MCKLFCFWRKKREQQKLSFLWIKLTVWTIKNLSIPIQSKCLLRTLQRPRHFDFWNVSKNLGIQTQKTFICKAWDSIWLEEQLTLLIWLLKLKNLIIYFQMEKQYVKKEIILMIYFLWKKKKRMWMPIIQIKVCFYIQWNG